MCVRISGGGVLWRRREYLKDEAGHVSQGVFKVDSQAVENGREADVVSGDNLKRLFPGRGEEGLALVKVASAVFSVSWSTSPNRAERKLMDLMSSTGPLMYFSVLLYQ